MSTVTMTDYEDRMLKLSQLTAKATESMALAAWLSFALGTLALVVTVYFSCRDDRRKEKNKNQQNQLPQNTAPTVPSIVPCNVTFSFGRATSERFAQSFQDISRQPEPAANTQVPQVLSHDHVTISDMRGGEKCSDNDNDSSSISEIPPADNADDADDSRPSRLRRRPARYGSKDN
ncbi:hypothetical protein O988_03655 [Pseudogymnoascus sp. VKM F-3808]|nr:hypothetical protein O988_03655 [Pseudogymnoascus sp. VKM F-3808]